MTLNELRRRATKTKMVQFKLGEDAAALLRRIVEEVPLQRWLADGIRRGEVNPVLYRELFGRGEGAGLEDANGHTLQSLIVSLDECEAVMEQLGLVDQPGLEFPQV